MARVPLPEDVDARDLDSETRRQLMSLAKDTAELVGKHLVMAGRLMDEDPTQALAHARAARALAGRLGVVREANGLVAYTAGEWAEALSELRAARRMTGQPDHLAVMADCERALGNPDRALLVTQDPQAKDLDPATKVELMIVASGARRDLGQAGTAVALLQVPALDGPVRPWTARLRYAYADALLDAGREEEARGWFSRAADADPNGETDAEDRLLELDGVVFVDLEDSPDGEDNELDGSDARDGSDGIDGSDGNVGLREGATVAVDDTDARAAGTQPAEPLSAAAPDETAVAAGEDDLRLFD